MKNNIKRLGFFVLFATLIALSFVVKQPTELPITGQLIKRQGYELFYSYKNRQATWIKEVLKASDLEGNASRKDILFKPDDLIPEMFRSTNADYQGSRLDRGHLKPAGDCKADQEAMAETFILSNISPQNHQLNSGLWLKLERHVRQLAKDNGSATIYTGGVFVPKEKHGKKYIKYRLIGDRNVAVPNAFFKIAVTDGSEEAYLIPNNPTAADQPLENYRTTIKKIESIAGVVFPKS